MGQNLSIVDTTTNTVIGEPLKTWADWPMSGPDPEDESELYIMKPLYHNDI
jgi:hypothetical protein